MKIGTGMVALVTGTSRGLGVEIARLLAQQGCDLVLAARSGQALEAVATELRAQTGRKVSTLTTDLADAGAASDLARRAEALGPVDILINNAGVESALRFVQRSTAEIEQTLAINLLGPMLLSHAVLPGMLARGRGHIVNIASVAGMIAIPFNEPYCATKFGMVGFTRSLRLTAKASGWPISASAVCPGFIAGAGLFDEMMRAYGVTSEGLGVCPLEDVGPAVVRAIQEDLPDVFVAAGDPRRVAALSMTDPSAVEAGALRSPTAAMFKAVADTRERALS